MKFLCGNCKAKYQIADQKISGRTLRMKCRRCQHDIIIKGQEQVVAAAAAGGARAPVAPRPSPAAKRAPQRGSALGADFRRSVGGPPQKRPAPPAPPPPAELWHVSINDVPVGPIRRQEVERKIQTGAVNGESLCWREGFDDWRPLAGVAELASLLRKQRPPAPSRRPPVGRGIGQRRHESRPRIRPSPSSRPAPAPIPAPAPPSNVVPIGGRLGGSASPEVEAFEDDATRVSDPIFEEAGPTVPEPALGLASLPKPAATLTSVPDAAPSPPEPDPLADIFGAVDADASLAAGPALAPLPASTAPPPRRKRVIPIGAWIAIAAAGAFGVTLAMFVATSLLQQPPEPVAESTATEESAAPSEAVPDLALEPVVEAPEVGPEDPEEAPEVEAGAAQPGSGARQPRGPRPTGVGTGTGTQRNLTAEQRALLERMGGQGSAGANIDTGELGSGSMMASRPELTSQQLTSVVSRGRRSLQRCYNLAIRGAGDPPTIRLDISITIQGTGRVSRVNASGRDIGGLRACVETNIRRWRFPAATRATSTRFPIVFAPSG